MKKICASCKKVVQKGKEPASHTICKTCYDKEKKKLAKLRKV